ncbi:NAD(P)-dependent oxidoreductase [uncultured Desulfosarcina sp.]|uniref:NAD-dependent epimerase/dehydratase family protein n=1 Tax=uncultured Desulfosarcina sp. TaxID=218289 RepID=UPI0029C6DD43|nr:NAD(P)-dependent oxidoreductase [uncultured Desulfosarcina sp.]
MTKKILITGGTGYIGTQLANTLLRNGEDVYVLTRNTDSATSRKLSRCGIKPLKGSISDLSSLKAISISFETVYHLAAAIDFRLENRDSTFYVNVKGTENVAHASLNWNAQNLVFASSVEAVGPLPEKHFFRSEETGCKPLNPYGESKLLAENRLQNNYFHQLNVKILRISNVYVIVPQIIHALLNRSFFLRYSDLSRDKYIQPIHLQDLTKAMIQCTDFPSSSIYFIVGDDYAKIGQFFDHISKKINLSDAWEKRKHAISSTWEKKKIKTLGLLDYWMQVSPEHDGWVYSNQKAKNDFDFHPSIKIENGIDYEISRLSNMGAITPAAFPKSLLTYFNGPLLLLLHPFIKNIKNLIDKTKCF